MKNINLNSEPSTQNFPNRQGWFLVANPDQWSMLSMKVDDVQNYTLFNYRNNKRRIFKNFLNAKAGDLVFGYESAPTRKIVALLKVESPSTGCSVGSTITFKKIVSLKYPMDFSSMKQLKALENMEFFANPHGSMFKLTPSECECLLDEVKYLNKEIFMAKL